MKINYKIIIPFVIIPFVILYASFSINSSENEIVVKEVLSEKEVEALMKPIIKNNFKGKTYPEFKGWLHKAIDGRIDTYNQVQINNWMTTHTNETNPIYDLEPISLSDLSLVDVMRVEDEVEGERKIFYKDSELHLLDNIKMEWLVENWIPKGDICFVAGKAASFKSTACLHFAYAIGSGKQVFNKYSTIQSKVLYLNEENSTGILVNFVNRIKKGLDIETEDNVIFSIMESWRIDQKKDLVKLVKYIKANEIKVIVFDSFRRFFIGQENDATLMNELFDNLKSVRKACNDDLTIIILHHLKKGNEREMDIRDMLRGSSDIVNGADTIIGIKRKHGLSAFVIDQVKTRAQLELKERLICLDQGEDENQAYFYESDKEMDITKRVPAAETHADELSKYLHDKKMNIFLRADLKELDDKYGRPAVNRAVKLLIDEHTLERAGNPSRHTKIYFNNPYLNTEKNSTLEDIEGALKS